jgi:hypothetical protein
MDKSTQKKELSPLKLTTADYWQELEKLAKEGTLPRVLAICLKSLVCSHINKSIPPQADPYTTRLAKGYLVGGIMISDSAGDSLYDVMVFVPNPEEERTKRSFFRLVYKGNGGRLKYLDEI